MIPKQCRRIRSRQEGNDRLQCLTKLRDRNIRAADKAISGADDRADRRNLPLRAEEMIDNGTINKDGAESSVNKNIITRAVGTERTVLADFYRHSLNDGDIVMLCTDGLTNMVSDDEIKEVFDNNEDLDGCVQILVNRANNRGGYDNSTVVAIRV